MYMYCRLLLLPGFFPQIESIKQCYMITKAISCQGLVDPSQTLAVGGGDERLGKRSAGSNGTHRIPTTVKIKVYNYHTL